MQGFWNINSSLTFADQKSQGPQGRFLHVGDPLIIGCQASIEVTIQFRNEKKNMSKAHQSQQQQQQQNTHQNFLSDINFFNFINFNSHQPNIFCCIFFRVRGTGSFTKLGSSTPFITADLIFGHVSSAEVTIFSCDSLGKTKEVLILTEKSIMNKKKQKSHTYQYVHVQRNVYNFLRGLEWPSLHFSKELMKPTHQLRRSHQLRAKTSKSPGTSLVVKKWGFFILKEKKTNKTGSSKLS